MKWKPIEGAPRDGRPVLVAKIINGQYVHTPTTGYYRKALKKVVAIWLEDMEFTHFQPLPSTEVEP